MASSILKHPLMRCMICIVLWAGYVTGDAFDFSSGLFDPQGNIRQIEYARKAAARGSTLVGLCSNNFSCLVCFKPMDDSRRCAEEALWVLGGVGFAGTGLGADVWHLVEAAQGSARGEAYAWGSAPGARRLGRAVGARLARRAGRAAARPLAAVVLLAGPEERGVAPGAAGAAAATGERGGGGGGGGQGLYVTATEGGLLRCGATAAGRHGPACLKYLRARRQELEAVGSEGELAALALGAVRSESRYYSTHDGRVFEIFLSKEAAEGVVVDSLRAEDLQMGVGAGSSAFRIYTFKEIEAALVSLEEEEEGKKMEEESLS